MVAGRGYGSGTRMTASAGDDPGAWLHYWRATLLAVRPAGLRNPFQPASTRRLPLPGRRPAGHHGRGDGRRPVSSRRDRRARSGAKACRRRWASTAKPLNAEEFFRMQEKTQEAAGTRSRPNGPGRAPGGAPGRIQRLLRELGLTEDDVKAVREFVADATNPKRQINFQIAETRRTPDPASLRTLRRASGNCG